MTRNHALLVVHAEADPDHGAAEQAKNIKRHLLANTTLTEQQVVLQCEESINVWT